MPGCCLVHIHTTPPGMTYEVTLCGMHDNNRVCLAAPPGMTYEEDLCSDNSKKLEWFYVKGIPSKIRRNYLGVLSVRLEWFCGMYGLAK